MGFDPEDQEIIRLLTKMKDAERGYPEHMLVARRRSYLKRMGEISLGIPADLGIKNAAKDVKPSNISPATSTLVETALVVAIIAEASTVAYFYRDQLADFLRRAVREPRVQEVTPPPVFPTSLAIQEITPSPALTVPSETIWSPPSPTGVVVSPTSTPIPGIVNNNSSNTTSTMTSGTPSLLNSANTDEPDLLNSTPDPNDSSGNNGNNGNHYGQTPKPERTKENGNNPAPKEDKPPKDNEDQPPKDNNDQHPKDNEDKPPKEDNPPKDNGDKPPKDNNDKPPKN